MKLHNLEENLSRNAEAIFWAAYLLIPLFTGLLAYNWLPHEAYSPDRDELIASHEVSDGEKTGTVHDAWKDKKTGTIYTISDFEEHRRSESRRMAYTWFGYGIIGCAFFAFRQSRLAGRKYVVSFTQAMAVNIVIALFTYFTNEATNNRIIQ
ncbi:MAG TPA: hypothetical protein VII95_15250 [Terriglobales bacterium]